MPAQLWRHINRGTVYKIKNLAIMQDSRKAEDGTDLDYALMVVYEEERTEDLEPGELPDIWIRTVVEFLDGRFERVP